MVRISDWPHLGVSVMGVYLRQMLRQFGGYLFEFYFAYGIAPVYAEHLRMRSYRTTNCKRCFTEKKLLLLLILCNFVLLRGNIYFIVNITFITLIIRFAVFFSKTLRSSILH